MFYSFIYSHDTFYLLNLFLFDKEIPVSFIDLFGDSRLSICKQDYIKCLVVACCRFIYALLYAFCFLTTAKGIFF